MPYTALSLRRAVVVLLLVFAQAAGAFVFAQDDPMKRWEEFDFARRVLTPAELKTADEEQLKMMRGIVFGRHGRVFKDADIRNYLQERPWFKPNPQFQNSMLGETERRNLDLIRVEEARRHEFVQPGDLRLWQKQLLTRAKLGEHTGAEWRILRAEVEAIHGKRFDDQPWLQTYFEERYWYRPDPSYDPKRLTDIERRNIATIEAAQKRQRNVALSPGDMEHFQTTALTPEMLRGLGLYELRLLRNEVYARRGRQFRTDWLGQHFYGQTWYEPTEEFKEVALSEVERRNVETIVAYENRLKEELSTRPVSTSLLEGLFLEDARKLRYEIYARHGKVFREKWLQSYFTSFPWYKPNPDYTDRDLTAVEQRNVAAILAYEKKATSVLDAIEG
ncbi:MAG TPA: YARHG domain-containing protein [Pyrinomonadaceae bacterium]|nr:YARHG domain-containing protein [Pyrinomonadaceae bacterium]